MKLQRVGSILSAAFLLAFVAGCGGTEVDQRVDSLPQAQSDLSAKITMCHLPPGNPANAHTISVGPPAFKAHLAHGDYLGACGPVSCIGEDDGPCSSTRDCCEGLTCDQSSLCNP